MHSYHCEWQQHEYLLILNPIYEYIEFISIKYWAHSNYIFESVFWHIIGFIPNLCFKLSENGDVCISRIYTRFATQIFRYFCISVWMFIPFKAYHILNEWFNMRKYLLNSQIIFQYAHKIICSVFNDYIRYWMNSNL